MKSEKPLPVTRNSRFTYTYTDTYYAVRKGKNGEGALLLNLLPCVVLRGIDGKEDFVGFVLLFLCSFLGKDVD